MSSYLLAINTAQATYELALLEEGPSGFALLGEHRWVGERNAVETLLPHLVELLEETGLSKKELQKIVVVQGPGSFSSVRSGVAFANALAEGFKVSLYELNTFQLIERKAATKEPLFVILPAGGLDAGIYQADPAQWGTGQIKMGRLSDLLAEHPHKPSQRIAYELNETLSAELHSIMFEKKWRPLEAHELQTFGESFLTIGLDGLSLLKENSWVEAFYLKGPKITLSQDPWKQPNA